MSKKVVNINPGCQYEYLIVIINDDVRCMLLKRNVGLGITNV